MLSEKAKDQVVFQCEVQHPFTLGEIEDLLVTALEGGSNYWIESVDSNPGEGNVYDQAMASGIVIKPIDDDSTYRLNMLFMQMGMQIMALKYGESVRRIIDGTYDADDADVWLQLSLFARLVYG